MIHVGLGSTDETVNLSLISTTDMPVLWATNTLANLATTNETGSQQGKALSLLPVLE